MQELNIQWITDILEDVKCATEAISNVSPIRRRELQKMINEDILRILEYLENRKIY